MLGYHIFYLYYQYIFLGITGCICIVLPVSAASGLSVAEAIEEAFQHNPTLQAVQESLAVAEGGMLGARLWQHYPEVEIEGLAGREHNGAAVATREWTVALSQEVVLGKQRHWRIARATAVATQSHWQVQEAQRQLRREVQETFYRLLFLEEKQAFASHAVELAERVLHLTQERYRVGDSPQLAVNLANVALQQTRQQLNDITGDLRQRRYAFNRLLGRSPETPVVLSGTLDAPPPPGDALQARQQALQQRPDLQRSEAVVEEAQSAIALTRAERLPNLELGAVFQRQETGSTVENAFGGRLKMPLPLWNRQRGNLVSAQARQRMAERQRLALQQQVESDAAASLTNLEQLYTTLKLFTDIIVPQSHDNLALLQQAFAIGAESIVNLLTAQQGFITTNYAYLEARLAYRLGLVTLESSLGGGPMTLSPAEAR